MSAALPPVDSDSLRTVLHAVFAKREYRWTEPSGAWTWLTDWWARVVEWLATLRVESRVRYYLLLGVLTLVLAAILVHLAWLVWRSLRPAASGPVSTAAAAPVRDAGWHLAEALRLSAAGRFAEALAHRFLAVVLDLDARRVVQFHPSKTPAEYAAEARLDEPGRSELAGLAASLYRHLFGGTPIDADAWRRFDAHAAGVGLHAAAR